MKKVQFLNHSPNNKIKLKRVASQYTHHWLTFFSQNVREVPSYLDGEVRRFFNQKHNGKDALQFWKRNDTHLPRLASILEVLLCIPATSVQVCFLLQDVYYEKE